MSDKRRTDSFKLFGVPFAVTCVDDELRGRIVDSLLAFFPMRLTAIGWDEAEHSFELQRKGNGFFLTSPYGDGPTGPDEKSAIRHLRSLIRICIAANAKSHLFIHAGAVGIGDKVLVLPGDSHSGKTTLVRELVALGATYFSDEYAVIDRKGLVVPFPKALSVRGIEGRDIQTDVPAQSFGGLIGTRRLPVGWVGLFNFRPRARFRPVPLSEGAGRLMMIPHAIGLAGNPEKALNFLHKAVIGAAFFSSDRGDARAVARKLLQTLDK